MNASIKSKRTIALGFTTAMAAVLLAGCAAVSAPRADVSASAAQQDMARGRHQQAVAHAEAAVAADPRNADYRMVLGNAYLDAGRFASAENAFSDAMTLGDTSPRAALALALAQIAQAKYNSATDVLSEHENDIARADLGLALGLAGQPERGIHVLSNAIRGGENTVKMRQNLAYAYAMAGRWREARLMAAQDVPAGEIGARLEQWARLVPADAYQHRVAGLLGVPVGVADSGQPAHLALGNSPTLEQLAAEAVTEPAVGQAAEFVSAPALASSPELPPLFAAPAAARPAEAATPVPAPREFATAFEASAPAPVLSSAPAVAPPPSLDARRVSGETVVQQMAAATPRQAPRRVEAEALASPARAAVPTAAGDGSHLVQLGSFLSEAGARRAWNIYLARYPELAEREMVLTEAMVRGRHYWRVSAGGFDQRASSAMCSRVRSTGRDGCVTWAISRPLPGALDSGLRLARR